VGSRSVFVVVLVGCGRLVIFIVLSLSLSSI
jgi:hypothetical protein